MLYGLLVVAKYIIHSIASSWYCTAPFTSIKCSSVTSIAHQPHLECAHVPLVLLQMLLANTGMHHYTIAQNKLTHQYMYKLYHTTSEISLLLHNAEAKPMHSVNNNDIPQV